MRALLIAALIAASATAAAPAAAHQLRVFAAVEGGEVVVEARFSDGGRPVAGTVRVLGEGDALLATAPLEEDGTARLPLAGLDHAGGLTVEVETGAGHEDYWVLTPADIARGLGG